MVRTFPILPTILALVCGGLSARPAAAQTIPSPYRYIDTGQEAGLFLGTMSSAAGRFDLGSKSGRLYGARYSIELGGPFSLEGVGRILSTTRDVRDPARDQGDRTIGQADVRLASLDARVKFSLTGRRTWHRLSPYALAGGGISWDMAGASELDQQLLPDDRFSFGTSFLALLGAGVRWLPVRSVELRADGGLELWQLDTPSGYLDTTRDLGFTSAPPQKEWVSGLQGSVGLALRW